MLPLKHHLVRISAQESSFLTPAQKVGNRDVTQNGNNQCHSISQLLNLVITSCQRSFGKIMFSQLYIYPQVVGISGTVPFLRGGFLWYQVPSWGEYPPPSDTVCNGIKSVSGRYASYWSTFLLLKTAFSSTMPAGYLGF